MGTLVRILLFIAYFLLTSTYVRRTDEQGRFNPELIPDNTYYSPGDLAAMPQTQYQLFSSRNASVVRRHLNIMAQHGIDGLFLTRRGNEVRLAVLTLLEIAVLILPTDRCCL
jgi:hypothetical protein